MTAQIPSKKLLKIAFSLGLILMLGLVPSLIRIGTVRATGDAYFSLSPSSGSYTVGNTITMTISETSSSGDNTDAVEVNLTYPSAELQYQSSSVNGPFTLCPQQTGGGGSIAIACASVANESGTQTIATVYFSVIGAGSASVSMVSGPGGSPTNIVNNGGSSVWNGSLPTANYSLAAVAVAAPAVSSSKPKTTSTPKTTSSTTSTTTSTTTPAATTTTTTTTKPAPVKIAPPTGSISVVATESNGQIIADAKVILDNKTVVYTNKDGVANFAGVSSGSHSVTITKSGDKTTTDKLSVSPSQNEQVSYELASSSTDSLDLVALILALFVIILAGNVFYWRDIRPSTKDPTPVKESEPVIAAPAQATPAETAKDEKNKKGN